MPDGSPPGRGRGWAAASGAVVLVVAAVAGTGVAVGAMTPGERQPAPVDTAAAPVAPAGAAVPGGAVAWVAAPQAAVPRAAPRTGGPAGTVRATAVRIPSLQLRSDLVDLGVDAAGVLVPPASTEVAGWFAAGAVPGDPGPAVVAGHVDSRAGPGVFHALRDVRVGADVEMDRSDGRSVRYRVVDVQVVAKDAFPTASVYGPTPVPELSLVTCGGEFDHDAGHYLRNVVVSAVLVNP